MIKNIKKNIKNIFTKIGPQIVKVVKDNIVLAIIIAVVIVAVVAMSVYSIYFKGGIKTEGIKVLTAQLAVQKAIDYINNNILKGQGTVSLKETQEVSGLYKIKITFEQQQQDTDAYITKDGRYLFPVMQGNPIDLDENPTIGDSNASQITSCESLKKADKPILEAFIVSQCPYGTQMQRVLSKVVESVDLRDNIKVRYIGSISGNKITSMHGDEEAQENLRQICIREEQNNKYWDYTFCYIKKGETEKCLSSTGVDKNALSACMSDDSRGLKYAKEDFELSEQYGVQGSPTLVMGDNQIDEFSFGGRTADALKTIICCAFNNKPSLCSQELSKDSAAVGFSETYSSGSASNDSANCGE